MPNWTVYILKCGDGTLYTGVTNDLTARLAKHEAGRGAKYLRGRAPYEIFYQEKCATKSQALKRESAIKKLKKAAKMNLVCKSG